MVWVVVSSWPYRAESDAVEEEMVAKNTTGGGQKDRRAGSQQNSTIETSQDVSRLRKETLAIDLDVNDDELERKTGGDGAWRQQSDC